MSGHNTKRIVKNSFILYVRMFITMLIGLYTSRIVLDSLGAEDYGTYSIVGGIVSLLGFLNTVMVSTTNRFITIEIGGGDEESVSKTFSVSLIIHIGLSLLTLLLVETIGLYYIYSFLNIPYEKIPDAVFVLHFSALSTAFSIIAVPFLALITAHEDFSFLAIVNVLQSFLTLLASFLVSIEGINSLRFYAVLLCIIFCFITWLNFIYCKRKYKKVKFIFTTDKKLYKAIASFSSWMAIGAAASVGRSQGGALIINSFFGTVLNASFGIANQVNAQINQFAQNVGRAFTPQIIKSYGAKDVNTAMNLTFQSCKYSYFMLFIIGLPILLETDYIIKIWLKNPPQYISLFCQLMIVETLIINANSGLGTLVFANGQIKRYQLLTNTISLLNLPISFILFKVGLPPYGIVIGSIISTSLASISRLFVIKKLLKFNISLFIRKVYVPAIYSSLPTLVLFLFPRNANDSVYKVLFFIVISVILYMFSVWLLGINKEERKFIKETLINKIYANNENVTIF